MIIKYSDGKVVEAILLARTEDKVRVAIKGGDDVATFCNVGSTWVSEDCEPVRIEFAWQRKGPSPIVSAEDCCCSQELAAHLIHLLRYGSGDEELEMESSIDAISAANSGLGTPRSSSQA